MYHVISVILRWFGFEWSNGKSTTVLGGVCKMSNGPKGRSMTNAAESETRACIGTIKSYYCPSHKIGQETGERDI